MILGRFCLSLLFLTLLATPLFAKAQRVVFIYWSAEAQGLSVDQGAIEEVRKLSNRTSNPDASHITTVLYYDPFDKDGAFTTPVREVYVEGEFRSDVSLRFKEEKNFGDGTFFKEALQFFSQFEGDQKIILLAGHGSSWMPKGGKEYDEISLLQYSPYEKLLLSLIVPASFGYDQGHHPEDSLTVFELKEAFESLPIEKRKVDLIWYYTCLMNNLEYLYEHREFSTFVLAGDASLSSTINLSELFRFQDQGDDTETLAKKIAQSNFQASTPDATNYILTNSAKLETLVQALKPLAQELLTLGGEGELTSAILEKLQSENKIFNRLLAELDDDVDLFRFLSMLKTLNLSQGLQTIVDAAIKALKEVIVYSPYDDFQSLISEIKEWKKAHGDVTQPILDQWLLDARLGRNREGYVGNLSAQIFNERIVGALPLDSAYKYTNDNDSTFDLAHEFKKHLKGEFKPKEYLSFFYPSSEKLSEHNKKLKFGNEVELKALPFYKKLSFSKETEWWKLIEQRLPENKIHWLKEFKGSNEDRRDEENRRKFHDQGL